MASRQRRHFEHIFDVVAELAAPSTSDGRPFVLWKHPENFDDTAVEKAMLEFSFPLGNADHGSSTFAFVLTNAAGEHTYAYCRHASQTCLCICTARPWSNCFDRLLQHITRLMNNESTSALQAFLENTYAHAVPTSGEQLTVQSSLGKNQFSCRIPNTEGLPTVQDCRDLLELYNVINIETMTDIYSSLLRERRLILTGTHLAQISHCALAITSLIYPMHWQHIFIPVLPKHLTSYLVAPMPYIIGVHSAVLEQGRREHDIGECVIIDIDTGTLMSPFLEVDELPKEVKYLLRQQLSRCEHQLGDGLVRSFLRATVALIGNYRAGFVTDSETHRVRFDYDNFVMSQRVTLHAYLNDMRHLQLFRQFVEERIDALNAGDAIEDEFEAEVRVFEFKKMKTSDVVKEKSAKALTGLRHRVNNLTNEAKLLPFIVGTGQPRAHSSFDLQRRAAIGERHTPPDALSSSRFYADEATSVSPSSTAACENKSTTAQRQSTSHDRNAQSRFYVETATEAKPVPESRVNNSEEALIDFGDSPQKERRAPIDISKLDEAFFDPLTSRHASNETPVIRAPQRPVNHIAQSLSPSNAQLRTSPAGPWIQFD